MKQWVPWRPVGAQDLEQVRSALQASIHEWSESWFDRVPQFECARVEASSSGRSIRCPGQQRWRLGSSLEIAAASSTIRACTNAALRGHTYSAQESAAAAALMEAFQRRMLHDLALRAAQSLFASTATSLPLAAMRRTDDAPVFARRVVGEFGVGDRAMTIGIAIDADALPRGLSGSSAARFEPVSGRFAALAASRARIVASIGSATISARELLALKPGDVVLTDRRVDQSIRVSVGTSGLLPAVAYPCRVGDRMSIQFSSERSQGGSDHGQ